MRLFYLAAACAVGFSGAAAAQSAWCPNGSLAAEAASTPVEGAQILAAKCKPGDIVFLPVRAVGTIGLACDFSRSVAQVGPNVMCTLAAPRPSRP